MRWAKALAIKRLFGSDGPRWIAERTVILALADDVADVERHRAIALRYERLLSIRAGATTSR